MARETASAGAVPWKPWFGDPLLRHPYESLAPPVLHDANPVLVHPIGDAKRRRADLPELSDAELGNDTPALWKVYESLDCRDDFLEEALADLGNLNLAESRTNCLEVIEG